MDKIIFFFIHLIICCAFISCQRDECSDINYGNKFLEPISKTFHAGDNVNAIVFIDSLGTEHKYQLITDVERTWPELWQDSCEGGLITITHQTEYLLRRFSLNKTALVYVQLAGFIDEEHSFKEDRIIDILKMSVYNDVPQSYLSRICIMTSDRGGAYQNEDYNNTQYIEHTSLDILGKTFNNVFEQKTGSLKMYYTRDDGIISFTDNSGNVLVLDHVE